MTIKGVIIMYKKRRKEENKYLESLEEIFRSIGFKNFKPLLSRVKSAEFSNRKNKMYSLLEFSDRKEEKNRIKEVDLLVIL